MSLRLSVPLFAIFCGCSLQAASAPSIAVFVSFETEPSLQSFSQMKEEVAAILKPSGLSLDWRLLDQRSHDESFPDLMVLKFSGVCQVRYPSMDSELGPAVAGSALASTMVSDGRVLPFSDVKCDQLRRFLAPALAGFSAPNREIIYGKALGRVVAHEMYHIFAGTGQHGMDGVARSFHTRSDLTGKEFRFTRKETATLRDVKWRALLAGESEAVSWHGTQSQP